MDFVLGILPYLLKGAVMTVLLTVVSMINTFTAIQQAGASGSAAGVTSQAGAIGLALFATAFGLVTAIPLVFAHVLFKDWIARYELKMKSAGQKLLVMLQEAHAPARPLTRGPVPAA